MQRHSISIFGTLSNQSDTIYLTATCEATRQPFGVTKPSRAVMRRDPQMETKMIDLENATRDELLAYAIDVKQMDFPKNIKTEALRKRLMAADGVVEVKGDDDAEMHKKVKIVIQSTGDDAGGDDVYIGVNGRGFLIKREEEVEVPAYVVEALKNAVQTKYRNRIDKETGLPYVEESSSLLYPFQIVV